MLRNSPWDFAQPGLGRVFSKLFIVWIGLLLSSLSHAEPETFEFKIPPTELTDPNGKKVTLSEEVIAYVVDEKSEKKDVDELAEKVRAKVRDLQAVYKLQGPRFELLVIPPAESVPGGGVDPWIHNGKYYVPWSERVWSKLSRSPRIAEHPEIKEFLKGLLDPNWKGEEPSEIQLARILGATDDVYVVENGDQSTLPPEVQKALAPVFQGLNEKTNGGIDTKGSTVMVMQAQPRLREKAFRPPIIPRTSKGALITRMTLVGVGTFLTIHYITYTDLPILSIIPVIFTTSGMSGLFQLNHHHMAKWYANRGFFDPSEFKQAPIVETLFKNFLVDTGYVTAWKTVAYSQGMYKFDPTDFSKTATIALFSALYQAPLFGAIGYATEKHLRRLPHDESYDLNAQRVFRKSQLFMAVASGFTVSVGILNNYLLAQDWRGKLAFMLVTGTMAGVTFKIRSMIRNDMEDRVWEQFQEVLSAFKRAELEVARKFDLWHEKMSARISRDSEDKNDEQPESESSPELEPEPQVP